MSAPRNRRSRPRPLARLLLDSLGDTYPAHLDPAVRALPTESVVRAAADHRIAPAVHRMLAGMDDVPPSWLAALSGHRHAQLARHLRAVADLGTVAGALDSAGVAWAAVKGPVLAEWVWPRVDLREYTDLDILVDRRTFVSALDALVDAGATLLDRNWPLLHATMRAELALRLPNGTVLDLHWDLAVLPELRRSFRLDTGAALERRTTVALQSTKVPTLDPADTLLHLAFHAAHAGGHRLVWLADVAYAGRTPGLDWDVAVRRAQQSRTEAVLATMVGRSHRVLGLGPPPPEHVLAPERRIWGRLIGAAEARFPPPVLPSDPRSATNVVAGIRPTLAGSVRTTIGHHLAARRAERAHEPESDHTRRLQVDVPDQGARTAYLTAVESGT